MAIQMKNLQVTLLTKASEPLELDAHTLFLLEDALDKAIREHVDLRYFPESRYSEERHEYLGVSLKETK